VWEGVATALMARESRGWPVTEGLVTSADSHVDGSKPPLTLSRDYGPWRRWQHQHITYNTAVTVRDVVADSTYTTCTHTTCTHTFGQTLGSGDGSEAELVRRRYPVGARVPVRYASMDPSLAVLEPGFSAEALGLPLAGFAINIAILFVLLVIAISMSDWPYMRVVVALFGLMFQLVAGRDPIRVVFRYVVADTVRFARQTVHDLAFDAEGQPSHAVWPYGLGHHLPVHVDPRDPTRAVVNAGLLGRQVWTAGIALFAILFGWIAQRLGRQVDAPFAGGGAGPLRSPGRGGI
jgi:hypothetical protein